MICLDSHQPTTSGCIFPNALVHYASPSFMSLVCTAQSTRSRAKLIINTVHMATVTITKVSGGTSNVVFLELLHYLLRAKLITSIMKCISVIQGFS